MANNPLRPENPFVLNLSGVNENWRTLGTGNEDLKGLLTTEKAKIGGENPTILYRQDTKEPTIKQFLKLDNGSEYILRVLTESDGKKRLEARKVSD